MYSIFPIPNFFKRFMVLSKSKGYLATRLETSPQISSRFTSCSFMSSGRSDSIAQSDAFQAYKSPRSLHVSSVSVL